MNLYWLEVTKEAILSKDTDGIDPLIKEANELVCILMRLISLQKRIGIINQITRSQNLKIRNKRYGL